MTSPDPVWAAGRPRVVVLGPTEEKLTERLMSHLSGLFHPRYGTCDGWAPGPGSTDGEVNARISTADVAVLVAGPTTPLDVMEGLQAHRPELVVVPVLARQFDVSMTPLRNIVTLPRSGPVSTFSSPDEALCAVADEMRELSKKLQAKHAAESQAREARPSASAAIDSLRSLCAATAPPVGGPPPQPAPARGTPALPPPWSVDQARWAEDDAERFASAVMSAFDRTALVAVMHYGLGVDLVSTVAPGNIRSQVLELHRWLLAFGRMDQFVEEATKRNPGDPNLRAFALAHRARAGNRPAWLQATPPDWPNADFQRFQEALCESYPDDGSVRAFLARCGVSAGSVQFTGRARTTWHDALRCAANQARMQVVFDRAVSENPAAFAAWRGGQQQAVDRGAVYDRLSRMLPAQLATVSFRLGVPQDYLPGSTASTSDHAIAIIRWAEGNGQMQRLVDAEAFARCAR